MGTPSRRAEAHERRAADANAAPAVEQGLPPSRLPASIGRSALIEGLGHVRLEVADLQRSVAFYRDGLRFRLVHRDDAPPLEAVLSAGDLQLVLTEVGAPTRRRGAGVRLSLVVISVDAFRAALVARGVHAAPPQDLDGSRSFTVRDPDGYVWQFQQSPR